MFVCVLLNLWFRKIKKNQQIYLLKCTIIKVSAEIELYCTSSYRLKTAEIVQEIFKNVKIKFLVMLTMYSLELDSEIESPALKDIF